MNGLHLYVTGEFVVGALLTPYTGMGHRRR